LVTLSSWVLGFEGKARANPIGDKLLVLPANVRLDWKVFVRCKHYSLLGLIVRDKGKTFYNTDPRCPNAKYFFFPANAADKYARVFAFSEMFLPSLIFAVLHSFKH
jgi:hypothetical protein